MVPSKSFLCSLIAVVCFWAIPTFAQQKVPVYFFWATGCPHCKQEEAFLNQLQMRYPVLDITAFEVKHNRDNALLLSRLAEAHGMPLKGVPATFVGDHFPVLGFRGADTTGREIEDKIRDCMKRGCADPSTVAAAGKGPLLQPPGGLLDQQEGVCPQDVECPDEEVSPPSPGTQGDRISLPLVGEIDTARTALPLQTFIIAAMDSFNPCAFFVLFTLLGLLIHARSRSRLLLIGGIFVFFSGFIYFIFMAAWLNVFLWAGQVAAVTAVAGVVALMIAVINIKDFFFFKKGVSLSIPEGAKPGLFDRMRRLLKTTSLVSVITGTVVLAVAANAYELFCTAGFPMVYTRILTLHKLSTSSYYLYLVLYNLIYVIPLASIVLVFAVTLGSRKLSEEQGRVLKLVSGIMMLCLGGVLLLRPELLSNVAATGLLLLVSLSASAAVVLIHRRLAALR